MLAARSGFGGSEEIMTTERIIVVYCIAATL
jgi:hypothetical protein